MCTVDKLLIKGIRSFSPDNNNVIEFYRPLTLIVGVNGAGKTTIIECLKQACTGELPPNTRSGQSFIHDPRMANETDIKAQIKLRFLTSSKQPVVVVRSFQLTEKKTTRQFKTLDSTLQTIDPVTGNKQAVTYRCVDIDKMVPSLMGVSKAVLENVIFVHQEESNWPLAEGKVLKDRFDDIFSATKYTKALETLRKMRTEKTYEIKEKRLLLENTRTHRDAAAKLQAEIHRAEEEISDGEQKTRNLDNLIKERDNALAALNETLGRLRALGQERQIRSVRMEELSKQVAAKMEALQAGGIDVSSLEEESLEDLQQALHDIDAAVEDAEREVDMLQRNIKDKRLRIQAENQQQNADITRHGRLAAESAAHAQRLAERDRFIRDTAASLGWSLPAGKGTLDTAAAQGFQQELTTLVHSKEDNLKAVKAANRKEDEDTAQIVEDLTGQITRKQAEMRVKQAQVAANNSTIDNLIAQIADIKVNEQALGDAQTKVEDIGDQLRKRRHEQSTSKLEEKVVNLRREVDDLAAKIAELRAERNRVTGSSETLVQLRLKRSSIADMEAKLNAVQSKRRRELLQLLGTADLPAASELKQACQSALFSHQVMLEQLSEQLKAAQVEESQIKGQLTAARSQLNTATQQLESLRGQVRVRQVQLPMVESDDLQSLTGLMAEYTEITAKKRDKKEKNAYLQKNLKKFHELICGQDDCPVCSRKFANEAEKQLALDSLQEALADLPQKVAQGQAEEDEAQAVLGSLKELHGLVAKVTALEEEQAIPLTHKKDELQQKQMTASLKMDDLREQFALMEHDMQVKKELVAEVAVNLDHLQQELGVLRSEMSRLEARLSAQSAHARSAEDIDEELEGLEQQQQDKERERERALRKQAKLNEEVVSLIEEESEARNQVQQATASRDKRDECNAKVKDLEALNAELNYAIQRFDLELKPLRTSREGHINDRSLARKRMQDDEEAAHAELRDASKLIDTLAEKTRAIQDYELSGKAGELEEVAAKMCDFKRRITALNQELEESERRCQECQQQQADKDQRKRLVQDCLDVKQVQQQIALQDAEMRELDRQQAELGSNQDLLQQQADLEQARSSLQRQLDRLQGAKGTHEQTRARAERDLRAAIYDNIHVRYNKLLAEVTYLEMANSDLDKYYKALEKALLSFHTTKMADINKIVRELWQKTYRGQDIDYIKIVADADGARSYNYRVIMVAGGAELEMRGRCSAGQKVLACLVIRLALAETFCLNCGILALDEPTTNLDAENASSLAEALKAIMFSRKDQENFQLIVITHDESFAHQIGTREHAEYLWRVVKDEGGHTLLLNDLIAGQ